MVRYLSQSGEVSIYSSSCAHPVSQDRKYFLLWVQLKSQKTPGRCLPGVVFRAHMRQALSSHTKSQKQACPFLNSL